MGDMVHGRLDIIGAVGGKEILNTLWYRLEESGGVTATVAAALAAEWIVTVSPQWVKFSPANTTSSGSRLAPTHRCGRR